MWSIVDLIDKNLNQINKNVDLVIGYFDGIHKGHLKLFNSSDNFNVLTFDNVPKKQKLLYCRKDSIEQIANLTNVKQLLVYDVLKNNLTAQEFIDTYLKIINPKRIIVGSDFKLGSDQADYNLLIKNGFELVVIPKNDCSTTKIKQLILNQEIQNANQLLVLPFYLKGEVIQNNKRGRTIGFRTANIKIDEHLIDLIEGSYICNIILDEQKYQGVAFIGKPKTFNEESRQCEAHIFDFNQDIYGKNIKVEILKFIRPTTKFNSIDELKQAIEQDKKNAIDYFNSQPKEKVIIALSGGVDSAVCAYLLKQQGYDVSAAFMQNWDSDINLELLRNNQDDKIQGCDAKQDYEDAKKICEQLNIELHYFNFVEQYWNDVFLKMLEDYKKGLTPNPDVLCNQFGKFGWFINALRNKFGNDIKIAFGHYAKLETKNGEPFLVHTNDHNKDQTYFLTMLNKEQLRNIIFPLSDLDKPTVRKIAQEANLYVATKKDSTGICFIGERNFKNFLSNYLKINKGPVVLINENKIVGEHDGLYFYTIGQSKRLNVGGTKEKIFVCNKDLSTNTLYVCYESTKDQYLASESCEISNFNWLINDKEGLLNKKLYIRFRHRQKLQECEIVSYDNDKVVVKYEKQIAVTLGQYGVIYDQNLWVVGGGKIIKIN
ncbi:tRNA 2-thiouridine(34) synthase MnmA [Mycoplasma bradburyae]|uniref:tRNA 2-thiouridine(34) synthase MnmA n=1 Tax=Mycoplasma bradburyae TaxID=2963128 RepID=UPI00233FDEC7|nr:tRNA 2-thiouridine(34) synthase MnmA [Mycoplasma bradburyae]MDC4183898.1 tRNA 2-thiouridine(34) synthase MnmA [Mycoplasma bradburyae]